jgi:hypothetical protein
MSLSPPTRRRSAWKAASILVLTLLIGVFLGIAGTLVFVAWRAREMAAHPERRSEITALLSRRFERKVATDLTEAERQLVHREIEAAVERLLQLRKRSLDEARQELNNTVDEIARALPPEKRETFRQRGIATLRRWGLAE